MLSATFLTPGLMREQRPREGRRLPKDVSPGICPHRKWDADEG